MAPGTKNTGSNLFGFKKYGGIPASLLNPLRKIKEFGTSEIKFKPKGDDVNKTFKPPPVWGGRYSPGDPRWNQDTLGRPVINEKNKLSNHIVKYW
jgi:hypothetical protein